MVHHQEHQLTLVKFTVNFHQVMAQQLAVVLLLFNKAEWLGRRHNTGLVLIHDINTV